MLGQMLDAVRGKAPRIHNITNYVTATDCANVLLACGASPIMADDIKEAAQITSICAGLHINLGTLQQRTVPSMLAAGKKASALKNPIVLDPVGVGASDFRLKTAGELLQQIQVSVIRGNASEIRVLAGIGNTSGIDAELADRVTEENLAETVLFLKGFAERTGAVISMTGQIDVVADKDTAFCIRNGHAMMQKVTGVGCRLSAITAAFAAANPDNILTAAAAAVSAMGLCGQIAAGRMRFPDGSAAYGGYLLDAVSNLTGESLEQGADYEIR